MKCKNCGGEILPHPGDNYLKCPYCGTYSPNTLSFVNNMMGQNLGLSNDFEILNAHEDYNTLKEVTYTAIKSDPKNWMAYVYYGISEYWLGSNDFKHLEDALVNFNRAFQISPNEQILEYKRVLLAGAVSLACKNKIYGEDLSNTIRVFELCKSENVSLPAEIVNQQLEYCNQAISKIIQIAEEDLSKKKKDFDITYVNLVNLWKLSLIVQSLPGWEKFYIYGKYHLSKHTTISYYDELNQTIAECEKLLNSKGSSVVGKQISFNFFGKLKIE